MTHPNVNKIKYPAVPLRMDTQELPALVKMVFQESSSSPAISFLAWSPATDIKGINANKLNCVPDIAASHHSPVADERSGLSSSIGAYGEIAHADAGGGAHEFEIHLRR